MIWVCKLAFLCFLDIFCLSDDQAMEIMQQDCSKEVLINCLRGDATEELDTELIFDSIIEGFDSPSLIIELSKLLEGAALQVE